MKSLNHFADVAFFLHKVDDVPHMLHYMVDGLSIDMYHWRRFRPDAYEIR
jgi:hypothetical protein